MPLTLVVCFIKYQIYSIISLHSRLVEGKDPAELGDQIDPAAPLTKIMTIFVWECSKNAPRDIALMSEILIRLGLPEGFIGSFCTFYKINKRRFMMLKDSLSLSAPRYRDLSWRLDMEIGRRSIANITEPSYMLRLDLNGVSQSDDGSPILSVFDKQNHSAGAKAVGSFS